MRKQMPSILLVFVLLIGLSLLLYPSFSDYWNSFHQSRVIANYSQSVENMDPESYREMWNEAEIYNAKLLKRKSSYMLTEAQEQEYESLLSPDDDGMMGYIEIPSIDCRLPVYHGTNEGVLQIAIGHLEWSSLPVGGRGTHTVLSGHRGLPSAKLFTNIDQLEMEDTFVLRILNEVLTYEVDQILVVKPEDVEALAIDPNQDYCTLVTCTPYGVNTHRLLVRGHRIPNSKASDLAKITSDATQIDPLIVMPILVIILLLLMYLLLSAVKKMTAMIRKGMLH